MFIAALFTTAQRGRQYRCPSREEWIAELWSVHTMEYYSAIKMNEILTRATTWMNLEKLNEISQTQKDKYCDSTYMEYLEWANS